MQWALPARKGLAAPSLSPKAKGRVGVGSDLPLPVARARWAVRGNDEAPRGEGPRVRRTPAAYFATGRPSASITLTSPRFKARTGCSIVFRSPTTTQVSAFGSSVFAAACASCGVIASLRAL